MRGPGAGGRVLEGGLGRAPQGDPGILGRAASDGREHGPASAEREPGLGLGLILESPRSQEVLGSPRRSQDSGKL